MIVHDDVLLPTDEVYYYGQVVVWAVGEPEAKVVAEYEALSAIKTVKKAIANARDDLIRAPKLVICDDYIGEKSILLLKRELGLD